MFYEILCILDEWHQATKKKIQKWYFWTCVGLTYLKEKILRIFGLGSLNINEPTKIPQIQAFSIVYNDGMCMTQEGDKICKQLSSKILPQFLKEHEGSQNLWKEFTQELVSFAKNNSRFTHIINKEEEKEKEKEKEKEEENKIITDVLFTYSLDGIYYSCGIAVEDKNNNATIESLINFIVKGYKQTSQLVQKQHITYALFKDDCDASSDSEKDVTDIINFFSGPLNDFHEAFHLNFRHRWLVGEPARGKTWRLVIKRARLPFEGFTQHDFK